MAARKHVVKLTKDEREQLLSMIKRGTAPARKLTRARILLRSDEGMPDRQIAEALDTSRITVWRTRKRFEEEGLGGLNERPRPGQPRKLNGKQEAHIIAVACSKAPQGHRRWTLRLLADKVVELGFCESFSHEAIRKILKKTNSNHGRRFSGAFQR